jgi:medium-chain acyl-[acyl-carrier-protein] hydrolase
LQPDFPAETRFPILTCFAERIIFDEVLMSTVTANPWVHFPSPGTSASLRLFCFPYAGGSAAAFRRWSKALPETVEVCPILLPGREARLGEAAFSNVVPLLEALVPALVPHLDKPFVLFGHSMGALVAFELARKLRREHNSLPEHLFVSAREAPGFALTQPLLSPLPDNDFIHELSRFNGSEQGALQHPELMKLMLPTLRADFALHERYEYLKEPALECPITVFGGLQDTAIEGEGLNAWRAHTSGSFVRRMFPGDHFFINSPSSFFLSTFSQELQRIIAAVRRQPASDCACPA